VVFDEIGSYKLPKSYLRDIRDAGGHISAFNTRQGLRNRFQLNFRNHRKIVVVDGREAWIGGHNVGDEYLGLGKKFGPWRDTHVHIVGPAVLQAQSTFMGDWFWAARTLPDLNWTPEPAAEGDVETLVLPTGPSDSIERSQLFFVHALNSAQERIWIASPYFVPDEAVIAALQLAALRGVDVRILLPNDPDHLGVYLCSFWYIAELEDVNVHFYRYTAGFMHQKVMLVDDTVASVGTANFDNRSFRLNFEVTAVFADPDFALEVERMLQADFDRSIKVPKNQLEEKGFWFTLAVRLARLTAPIQ
jgi:cardiolipin synthase